MNIKRYTLCITDLNHHPFIRASMDEDDQGVYVAYSDYETLVKDRDRLATLASRIGALCAHDWGDDAKIVGVRTLLSLLVDNAAANGAKP